MIEWLQRVPMARCNFISKTFSPFIPLFELFFVYLQAK